MRPDHLLAPLLAAVLLASGCKTAVQPGTFPIAETGARTDADPGMAAPDAAVLAVARAAVDIAGAIGPAVAASAPVLAKAREMRKAHPPQASYALQQVDGWRYLGGWWSQESDDGKRTLRVTIEDTDGKVTPWDVTSADNYAPDLHAAFPTGLVRARIVLDQQLASGGRFALTVLAPLGEAGQVLQATGTGSLATVGEVGSMGLESIDARIGLDGAIEKGDLILKSLGSGTTITVAGSYNAVGFVGPASLQRSARPVADLVQEGGRWQLKNSSGTYYL